MKIYWSNDSYPELGPIESRWRRHIVWWRAFWSARKDYRFWLVIVGMLSVAILPTLLGFLILPEPVFYNGSSRHEWVLYARFGLIVLSGLLWMVIALTIGAEVVRPHLRRASPLCRQACPECGQLLTSQIEGIFEGQDVFQCPECGAWFDRTPFFEPYDVHARADRPPDPETVKPSGALERMKDVATPPV